MAVEDIAAIKEVAENLAARVVTLEGLVAQQRVEINAAGTKFILVDAEINQL